MDGSRIVIRVGDQALSGTLDGSEAARELLAQLPLQVRFRDVEGVEVMTTLPAPLTRLDPQTEHEPAPGDIAWFVPYQVLAIYHGPVGRWTGLVPLGRLDSPESLPGLGRRFTATIEQAPQE